MLELGGVDGLFAQWTVGLDTQPLVDAGRVVVVQTRESLETGPLREAHQTDGALLVQLVVVVVGEHRQHFQLGGSQAGLHHGGVG